MTHNHITTDSPLSRRIVRAFLQFLNSVEPSPGVDAEGIEVARECLVEAFRLNSSPVNGDPVKPDSLIDIFKSLEANKQCETSKSDIGPQPDSVATSSSLSGENPAHAENHSQASKSMDEDWTQDSHAFVSKDELCGQFFAALEKNHYCGTNTDGSDDPVQLEKACRLFDEAFMEMERSGCHQFSLKNLAESLKSLGNKAMQAKQYSDAIDLYDYAIALHEKSAVYYCNRAAAYTQINKYTEAIQDCLRSIEIDPNYSKAYSRLGLAYYAQGNYRDAIEKGFIKALQLDPNNESVKENILVAERKLLEEQHHADHNQSSRSSQEFQNQSARGSRSHAVPPPFSSMPFNPNDLASMFMNIAANATNVHQGSHTQERQEDSNSSGANEPEIRIGGNISVNFDQMPEDITGAFQSMMEMLSGAVPPGQPHDQMNGRTPPN
ncbi:small glutamine-rich tetratricopeptide repeat-containing protein isoform X2 [Abrus precatorius]|uniref:Small glutamine-rich tetratricopeptide repeat-containing protein isoform X2 n=1 Tax=Abrus precatorius TaxID=3816 RepID=A0A8B8JK01_ABRPR|nr:small glutamine-rich tetratricopeptide repeat-containing protein isoform X2 [Abrus precatorius]